MPRPQLNVRCISSRSMLPARCSQSNTAGLGQRRSSITASRPAGSTRGMLPVGPPPVMCAIECTGSSAINASTDFT